MKNIIITGKTQIDKIKKASNFQHKLERNEVINWPDKIFSNNYQISLINQFFLSEYESKNEINFLEKELKKKLNSYQNQDNLKKRFNNNNINLSDLIEKLVVSKLKCFYCKKSVKIFYKDVRDMDQWTLDRIDNSLPHNNNNVEICCLKCNLDRKNIDKNKFKFTKQLKIQKEN